MIISYRAKATSADDRELVHDTMSRDEAYRWCSRWVEDGQLNVRVTVTLSENVWGAQVSRTYRYLHDIRQLGPQIPDHACSELRNG